VAHRDYELRADKDPDLPEEDRLRLVHIPRRPQHEEERVAVALELRALMGIDGVLDRQLVQVELARDGRELLAARLVQPQPRDGALALASGAQLREVVRL
jgi:hypothetical protein